MLPFGLLGVALVAALGMALAVRRWPSRDPSAPRLETSEIRSLTKVPIEDLRLKPLDLAR